MDETKDTTKRQSGAARQPFSKPREGDDPRTQAEKFEAAAGELGCDPDDDRFKSVARKLAKPKS